MGGIRCESVTVEALAAEFVEKMRVFTDEVNESIAKAADMCSKELVADIKSDSPIRTGEYKKGWKRKKLKGGYIVYNGKKPQLTAVLERGYTYVSKETGKRVSYNPKGSHIVDNAERLCNRFENYCIDIVCEGVRF